MPDVPTSPAVIDRLAERCISGDKDAERLARDEIRARAASAGITVGSLYGLYREVAKGAVSGFTVPALNVRGLSYEFIRAILRASRATHTRAFIIEIARSEIGYSAQPPEELVALGLAAALREGFDGPLFFQGDHYKIDPARGIDNEVRSLERLIEESLAAGMRHIDIDASKTVDLSQSSIDMQQSQNGALSAHLASYVRSHAQEPVIVGGEIGEIGGKVSTPDDLRAFMTILTRASSGKESINKVAVQTGTSHGGIPNADGSVRRVKVDLKVLKGLSRIAREEFELAGAVQHGASTLTEAQIGKFPLTGAVEVHLSTVFQNIIFDHPSFPKDLTHEIERFVVSTFGSARPDDQTERQFIYKQRKHAWGPFKRTIASMPGDARKSISATLEEKIARLFRALHVQDTDSLVARFHH